MEDRISTVGEASLQTAKAWMRKYPVIDWLDSDEDLNVLKGAFDERCALGCQKEYDEYTR